MSSDDELCDTIWAAYNEAVGVQERKRYPVIGPSVNRRAFAYTASMHNDKRTHAYMCFVCSAIKVDTGRIRSDIKMMSGEWLFSMPYGALRKKLSLPDFKKDMLRLDRLCMPAAVGIPTISRRQTSVTGWCTCLNQFHGQASPWITNKTRHNPKMKQMNCAKKDCCVALKITSAHKGVTTTK